MREPLQYHVVASDSHGNCVIIEDIMVDCGVSYDKVKPYLDGVTTLLLTHIHSDHIDRHTLEMIRHSRPDITVVGSYHVAKHFDVDVSFAPKFPLHVNGYDIQTFSLPHDVPNFGFSWKVKGNNILFATDTSSLDDAPHEAYDYMFLESSYDEAVLREANRWAQANRRKPFTKFGTHLSRQEARAFFDIAKRGRGSILVELHQSPMFIRD